MQSADKGVPEVILFDTVRLSEGEGGGDGGDDDGDNDW